MNDRPLTHVSSNINDLEPFIMVYQISQKRRYSSNAIFYRSNATFYRSNGKISVRTVNSFDPFPF